MGYKKQDLTEPAWVSRFWAHYNRLSEPLKKGFYALTESVSKETGKSKPSAEDKAHVKKKGKGEI